MKIGQPASEMAPEPVIEGSANALVKHMSQFLETLILALHLLVAQVRLLPAIM